MCGIVGYIGDYKREENTISNMLSSISHRGPDGNKQYSNFNYHAGMCRLAINDLESGDQPLLNRNKNVKLFYNGEIYNSPYLRKKLESKGYKFRTRSDGEVVCHLYDEYKTECFKYLDGMFSIALWDENIKTLYLARDPVGEKPLYYSFNPQNRELIFSSEIKAIASLDNVDLSFDRQSIWDFPTFLWIPEPNTIYENIKVLNKGHILKYSFGNISFQKFSGLNYIPSKEKISDNEIISRTKEVVVNAIKSRLLSDVPVGSFLSGGLDSSIVASVASKEIQSLSTFSIGFQDIPDFFHGKADESKQAEWFASELNTNHTTIKVNELTFLSLLDDFCKYGDQPFAVTSGLGILAIAEEAQKKGIKVLLSGDCADECFGGYSWYKFLNMRYSPQQKSKYPEEISMHNIDLDIHDKLKVLESYNSHERVWAWHYFAHENDKKNLFSEEFYFDINDSLDIFKKFNSEKYWHPSMFIAHDRDFYLTNEMLTKLDRMTMARSIEGRAPFASKEVLELANSISYSQMIRNDTLKWNLRKAFSDVIPSQILDRPKHGFNVPIDYWLKGSWRYLVEETFSENSALYKLGFIGKKSQSFASELIDSQIKLNGHTLFCFIMLNKWLQK